MRTPGCLWAVYFYPQRNTCSVVFWNLCHKLIGSSLTETLLPLSLMLFSFALSLRSSSSHLSDEWFKVVQGSNHRSLSFSHAPMRDIFHWATPSHQPSIKRPASCHQSGERWSAALGLRQLEVLQQDLCQSSHRSMENIPWNKHPIYNQIRGLWSKQIQMFGDICY